MVGKINRLMCWGAGRPTPRVWEPRVYPRVHIMTLCDVLWRHASQISPIPISSLPALQNPSPFLILNLFIYFEYGPALFRQPALSKLHASWDLCTIINHDQNLDTPAKTIPILDTPAKKDIHRRPSDQIVLTRHQSFMFSGTLKCSTLAWSVTRQPYKPASRYNYLTTYIRLS